MFLEMLNKQNELQKEITHRRKPLEDDDYIFWENERKEELKNDY